MNTPEAIKHRLGETTTYIRSKYPHKIQGAVVLGSGLGVFAERLENAMVIPYKEIPHFPESTVEGHAGNLILAEYKPGFFIACMQGRFHYYEGYDIHEVVYPIRVLHQLGSEFLLVTNAAGGINTGFKAGNLMLIEDHLNMMGMNPLLGRNLDMLGPRFPDMSQAYNKQLIEVAEAIGKSLSIDLVRGIYAAMSGPTYETPAEVRMLQCLGADAVGMSTVPEVIVANHMSMKVLGISCISNLAAGLSPVPLSHAEVMETAEQVKPKFIQLLSGILDHLAEQLSSAS